MKKFYLSALLILGSIYLSAQEEAYIINWTAEQADSVKKEFRRSTNDTLKMKMSRSLGVYFQEINRDTSIFYTHMQMALAKKLNQRFWEADAYEAGGWLMSQIKNYPLSIEYLLTGLKMAEDKSIEKNIWQLSFFSPKSDPTNVRLTTLGFIHNDLSQLYNQTGDVENEMAQLQIGIGIGNQISNDLLLALLKSNLSQLYEKKNQPDSVIYYGQQSLNHMQKSGYKTYEGYELTLMADAYIQKGDFAKAKSYLDQSVIANQVNGSVIKLADTYLSYATMYKLLNRPDSSIAYLNKAVSAFIFFNQPEKIKRSYKSLYLLYKANHPDSAYHYLQLYQALSDSLAEQETKQIHRSQNYAFDKQIEQQQVESQNIAKANTNRTYAFLAGIAVLLLIAFLLLRNNRSRRKANMLLQKQNAEIEEQKAKVENTLTELKITQGQLIQAEKMASLGQLTAGIAHEIQNPLNFVNNFSEVSEELIKEMLEEVNKGNIDEVKAIAGDLVQNLEKIYHHGKRADSIVKGMLEHSRTSTGNMEPTDINALADEYLRLSYHGIRAKDKTFNTAIHTDFDNTIGKINIISQDIGRVLLNLYNNAFYAVNEKKKTAGGGYEPTISLTTKKLNHKIEIKVSDNGNGIPQNIVDKIFQPFFTTKPTGQGTGLGLSLSYDIVKAHGGEINVESKEGKGTEFVIKLPIV